MAAVSQRQAAIMRPSTAHDAVLKLYSGLGTDDNPVLFAVMEASPRKRSSPASCKHGAQRHRPRATSTGIRRSRFVIGSYPGPDLNLSPQAAAIWYATSLHKMQYYFMLLDGKQGQDRKLIPSV